MNCDYSRIILSVIIFCKLGTLLRTYIRSSYITMYIKHTIISLLYMLFLNLDTTYVLTINTIVSLHRV